MGVDSKHPLYDDFVEMWRELRDATNGEPAIKRARFKYLPATANMIADGALVSMESQGGREYASYITRAHYPDVVPEAVEAMIGVMHRKPPAIELPEVMEPMRENATMRNESLDMLLRRINEEQLGPGRLGLLGDVIDTGPRKGVPYISLYTAEDIINWDEGERSREVVNPETGEVEVEIADQQSLNFVALEETGYERQVDFSWQEVQKYRVLALGDPEMNEDSQSGAIYRFAEFRDGSGFVYDENMLEAPLLNGRAAESIPFSFINTKDVVAEPDEPPLLGLSSLALLIYRGEADYRQALFMQGQDTLVVIGAGEDKVWRIGAGASINIPSPNGDAKFIGVDSQGLVEMREALENDYRRALQKAGQMLDTASRQAESGDALRIRVSARTATLTQIAITGAYGLEQCLRKIAAWMGANPEQVKVTPNLDFVDDVIEGRTLVEYMTAKSMGIPWSLRSIHERLQERGLTNKTWDEEVVEIEGEEDLELGGMQSSNVEGPESDPVEPGEEVSGDDGEDGSDASVQ